MCEVTNKNFEEIYGEICDAFKNAVFISLDCEFSALHIKSEYKDSLFDTPCQRYYKTKKNLENSIPLEIGLTVFTFDRDDIVYTAKPYKFYVFPASFASNAKTFLCQSSAFHFLGEHNFDFNKFVYEGIPYLNTIQEVQLQKYIDEGRLYDICKFSLQNLNQDILLDQNTAVSEWYYKKPGETQLTLFDIGTKNRAIIYVLHRDLRSRFSKVLWTYEENQQFKVKRVTQKEYEELDKRFPLETTLLTSTLGFSRIYKLLVSVKKPIVGHNCLNDLVLLINTFDSPIPFSYSTFKTIANRLFPCVYDTKTISFEILKYIPEDSKWRRNGLQELYEYFKNETGRHLVPGSPRIDISENFRTYTTDKFHDAGWDAYCTGYCFIRMAHFIAARDYPTHKRKIFMSKELLRAVEPFKNNVNIIRATIPYVSLSGPDPASQRPPCLIIQSTCNKPIDIFKVTELLTEYGSVDIKPFSSGGTRAIAAVANYGSVRRILGKFQNHKDFRVVKYNVIKHSTVFRAALWGGVLASSSVLCWIFHSRFLKS